MTPNTAISAAARRESHLIAAHPAITPNLLPVLHSTRRAVRELGSSLALSTHRLAAITLHDASLSLQVMAAANALRPVALDSGGVQERGTVRVETVSHAIPLIGIERYLALVRRSTEVESLQPGRQRNAIMATLAMAWHAAAQARAWAEAHHEHRSELAVVAAQARFGTDLALWALGPESGARLLADFAREPYLTDTEILGEQAADRFATLLSRQWRLPELAPRQPTAGPGAPPDPSEFGYLAARLARAASTNWYGQPLARCIELAADRLDQSIDVTDAQVRTLAAAAARRWPGPIVHLAARRLLFAPGEQPTTAVPEPWWTQQPPPAPPQAVTCETSRAPVAAVECPTPAATVPRPTPAATVSRPAPAAMVPHPTPATTVPRPAPATTVPRPAPAATVPCPTPAQSPASSRSEVSTTASGVTRLCERLREATDNDAATGAIVKMTVDGLCALLGFDHALFAVVDKHRTALRARYVRGTEHQALSDCFTVSVGDSPLLSRLLRRRSAIRLDRDKRPQVAAGLPGPLADLVVGRTASLMSVFIGKRAVGLFYADRLAIAQPETLHAEFTRVCTLAEAALAHASLAKRGGQTRPQVRDTPA